ncbi:Uncharacterised protein [Clostridioides difficile]|nr:Uncharacterised protein [Clostridioides difficile]
MRPGGLAEAAGEVVNAWAFDRGDGDPLRERRAGAVSLWSCQGTGAIPGIAPVRKALRASVVGGPGWSGRVVESHGAAVVGG